VAQEALANVRRHARAARAGLTLSYMEDRVMLDVRDDGIGFDPAADRPSPGEGGFGLVAMAQRLAELGGTLEIESRPRDGTTIVAAVPVGGGA
jgi:signal transduction histidine kinase